MGFLFKATKREVRATQISILEVQVEIEIARARRSGRSHAIMQKIGLALLCASAAALTLPKIAVLGRPNVGKSTIANRLTQNFDKGAVVFNEPGVTRDRLYSDGFWRDHEFTVVDTGNRLRRPAGRGLPEGDPPAGLVAPRKPRSRCSPRGRRATPPSTSRSPPLRKRARRPRRQQVRVTVDRAAGGRLLVARRLHALRRERLTAMGSAR